jgi:hypothetical protein
MFEAQSGGVQEHTAQARSLGSSVRQTVAVLRIAQYWVPDMRRMYADLVHPAGLDIHGCQGAISEPPFWNECAYGGPSHRTHSGHPLAALRTVLL